MTLKKRLHEILDDTHPHEPITHIFHVFILSLILLNVVAIILETVPEVYGLSPSGFDLFNEISVYIFAVEYLLRISVCTVDPRFSGAIKGRLRFATTPMAIIDLMAFLPFFLPFIHADLRFIRAIRLFRIFRIAKLWRYSNSLKTLNRILKKCKEDILLVLCIMLFVMVFAAIVMFELEHNAQPQVFPNIFATMWWALVTLTTVGYGDVYPVTVVGKLLAAVIAILGIAMYALPTAIIGSAFINDLKERAQEEGKCPHCGQHIEKK